MLKAIFLAALLLMGPVQGELLYVCHASDGMSSPCCGDQGDGMTMASPCDTEVVPAVLLTCMGPAFHEFAAPTVGKPSLEPDSARAPPAVAPPLTDILSSLPFTTAGPVLRHVAVSGGTGTDTYLLTLRLRI